MAKPEPDDDFEHPEVHDDPRTRAPAIDPVSHLPHDGRWYPAEVREGQWQARRQWETRAHPDLPPCRHADNDVRKGNNVRFASEAECQTRCDELNALLDRQAAKEERRAKRAGVV